MLTPNASPFLLRVEDVEMLSQSDGFIILRQHLAQHYTYELCDAHTPAHLEDNGRWLMTRDVLHALLVPIVELFDRAVDIAAQATHATTSEELEYAFTGEARGAFVWLQCFLENERDWAHTKGCPACIVSHSLDSEFTIRLLYAACLLSDVHYPFTLEGPTLPSFMFFLESLQTALAQDALWGPDYLESVLPKAAVTRNGIESLIHQCLELDEILSMPSSPADPSSPVASLPASPILAPLGGTANGMRVKRSRMARRQRKLQKHLEMHEEYFMSEMLKRCWDELQPGSETGMMPIPPQSLDAVLKGEPLIAENMVDELSLK
ncbi:hypothetical protein K431DRAFT_223658 [Polychaeton citri CBS 116435]|uniref:Uncharacterized protein n=1 Tax=Polychaeton citri CBS 116435 TaxID=1314669 RepID=A0A9P4UMV6_9PEZI|nr:hypothetical protein K431DRAFT_223658 [Polychaeton citri CBS 116435]